jgi:nucleotide-binding universal stress UspA family protein
MSEAGTTFGSVVVGIDGRPGGRDAIALARPLVAPEGRLALAHVTGAGPTHVYSREIAQTEHERSRNLLEQEFSAAALDAELLSVAAPSVGRGLHETVERVRADLLVVGSSHRGFLGRVLAGNDARAAANGAACAVAVAPAGYAHEARSIATIGVGYDGSPESGAAMALAQELAAKWGARVQALRVVQIMSSASAGFGDAAWGGMLNSALTEAMVQMRALEGVQGDAIIGVPGEELAAFGERVDLLAVGSRGYGPHGSVVVGSTLEHLLGHARCPLLVLPRAASAPADTAAAGGREATASPP